MPRLQNVNSKVVVSVSDETAELLGSEWVAPEAKSEPAPKPASRSSK